MFILGLTGPIASGKTTVADFFTQKGAVVISADKLVHELQGPGTAQTLMVADILGIHVLDEDGRLDRAVLGRHMAKDPGVLSLLEGIFHPAVRVLTKAHIAQAEVQGAELVVLDVPLLFETGLNLMCDSTAVCVSDVNTRRQRAFARNGMTETKWQAFHSRRLPEHDAFKIAEHHINTADSLERTKAVVNSLYDHLVTLKGKAWPDAWADVPSLETE